MTHGGSTMDDATPFQETCRALVDAALGDYEIEARYETHDGASKAGAPGGCFLRAEFTHGGRSYDLYIYAAEAAVHIDRTWYVHERHDYPDADSLASAFATFLGRCLSGENPADAARRPGRSTSAPD
jgi:hypothetical protein